MQTTRDGRDGGAQAPSPRPNPADRVTSARRETVYLEHHMAGRARLRVPKPRTPAHVRYVAARVSRSKRVHRVSANNTTGSLLVSFSADDPIDIIIEELRRRKLLSQSGTQRRD